MPQICRHNLGFLLTKYFLACHMQTRCVEHLRTEYGVWSIYACKPTAFFFFLKKKKTKIKRKESEKNGWFRTVSLRLAGRRWRNPPWLSLSLQATLACCQEPEQGKREKKPLPTPCSSRMMVYSTGHNYSWNSIELVREARVFFPFRHEGRMYTFVSIKSSLEGDRVGGGILPSYHHYARNCFNIKLIKIGRPFTFVRNDTYMVNIQPEGSKPNRYDMHRSTRQPARFAACPWGPTYIVYAGRMQQLGKPPRGRSVYSCFRAQQSGHRLVKQPPGRQKENRNRNRNKETKQNYRVRFDISPDPWIS